MSTKFYAGKCKIGNGLQLYPIFIAPACLFLLRSINIVQKGNKSKILRRLSVDSLSYALPAEKSMIMINERVVLPSSKEAPSGN